MVIPTSKSGQVSLLGKYANSDTALEAAVSRQVDRLLRRNAVRRYERRIMSVNTYLSRTMPPQGL